MLPHPLRLTAAAAALALPLGAGTALSPAAAESPRTGVAAAVHETAAPVASAATGWGRAKRAAEAALDRAQHALGPSPHAAADMQHDHGPDERDLTLTLRDLHLGLPYLDAGDRAAARSVLARPTDRGGDPNGDGYSVQARNDCKVAPTPGSNVCVYWVPTTDDAPPPADSDDDGLPDQVETTRNILDDVWDRIVEQGGYRAPLPDTQGFDSRLDVFLANIGDDGLFGYCAPESAGPGRTAAGYCVLDDDYAEFAAGGKTPLEYLQVTAAHEFFHAVQFAYDVAEDDWFMEGTAMWMEDEMYDGVNDNYRYLQGSQLTAPTRALDQPAPGMGGPYVSWVFWRFLSETFPDTGGTGLPLVVRDTWRRAQAYSANYPRLYSMKAVNRAVAARGNSLANVFARFGEAGRHPADAYTEGAAYPRVPPVASYTLSTSRRGTGEKVATMAHMTNYTVVLTPGSDLSSDDWVVRIPVNAPAYSRGARAQLSVVKEDGSRTRRWLALNKDGNGMATAQFRRGVIRRVELTLTNAGQRYRCNQGTFLSCQGVSLDNGLKTYFKATISAP